MAVKTVAQIMEQVKTLVGDDTSDTSLELIGDISDTLNDYEAKVNGDGTDWKKKFEENDAQWRQKYKDRFFSGGNDNPNERNKENLDTNESKEPELKTSFEELFSKGE